MPAGRPTKYEPGMCERVIECGREGFSKAEIAADLDVSRQTVDTWAAEHPAFLDALQRAHDLSLAWWEGQSREGLTKSAFQASLWAKAMNGRFPKEPYRERVETTGADGGPIQTDTRHTVDMSALTEEQLRAIASIKLPADV